MKSLNTSLIVDGNMNYTFVYPTGEKAEMNSVQYTSLCNVAHRHELTSTVTVHPMFGCKGIMVNTGTMWIGVEEDGYAHT